MIHESRFADLIIADPGMDFYEMEPDIPSHFVKEILAHAECPLLVAPRQHEGIEEIVFCYDGNSSSIYAAKQFTYLFPEFKDKKITILQILQPGEEEFKEEKHMFMDWLKMHYNYVYYQPLKGNVKDELILNFMLQRKKMIVMGAYGRSALSTFFKPSNADALMRMIDLPLFIAHE